MDALGQPASTRVDDYAELRIRMVEEQLIDRGIRDERVLEAMAKVPRHEFVPTTRRKDAYRDMPLPIDCGQTISQPFTVAFMCEAAELLGDESILEVGTGSGYGAAVLAELGKHVHTVERIPQLAHQAQNCLQRLGYENVDSHFANGTLGLPGEGPFDVIVVTAGAESLPRPYIEQLAENGRIVIPIDNGTRGQTLFRFTLRSGKLSVEDLGSFAFVPLIGGYGCQD